MSKPSPAKAAQRIAVAQDVIAQLDAQVYIAREGVYAVISKDRCGTPFADLAQMTDMQDIAASVKQCEVCAKGAVFLSRARLYNNEPVDKYVSNTLLSVSNTLSTASEWWHSLSCRVEIYKGGATRGVLELFGRRVWNYIEAEFEGFGKFNAGGDEWRTYPAEQRMRIIMQNIIDNGGSFCRGKLPWNKGVAYEAKDNATLLPLTP